MMSQSNLFGPSPSASGGGAAAFSPEYPADLQQNGDDFFSMVSQALANYPDKPPVPQSPEATPWSMPEDSTADSQSDSDADSSTAIGYSSRIPDRQSSSANDTDSSDPSVLSTIMALFAQPAAPPPENVKLAPSQGKNKELKITPDQLNGKLLASGEAVGSGVVQKSSTSPAPSISERVGQPSKLGGSGAMKSFAEAGKTPPAKVTPANGEPLPATAAKPPGLASQLTPCQDVPTTAQECMATAALSDGMGTALSKQRMKFVSEKNEIAGRAVQKLPDASSADDFSSDLAAKDDIKADPDLSRHAKDSFDPDLTVNLSAKGGVTDFISDKTSEKAQTPDPTGSQVERVAHLVAQEVITVRQSGASSLAVSLKLDPQTELFLQLTHHDDGQVQASLRCERGSLDGLNSHWGQLQESLARQNIHLLPLEDKTSSRTPVFSTPPVAPSSRSFGESSQNQQRQARDPGEEPSLASLPGELLPSKNTHTKTRSRQGWESWA